MTEQHRRHSKHHVDQNSKNEIHQQFPWMLEFRVISARVPTKSDALVSLMKFYYQNLTTCISECPKKSSRATLLVGHVRNGLQLFKQFHQSEALQDQSCTVYPELMSDLLAVYIDLELMASKRLTERQPIRISQRILAYMCICLEDSKDLYLETLMKLHNATETFSDILDPVFSKIVELTLPSLIWGLDGMAYVRQLLVYRLWKSLHAHTAPRQAIVGKALKALKDVPPSDLNEQNFVQRGILPSMVQNHKIDKPTTKNYMCKSYDIRRACRKFIKYSKSENDVATRLSNHNNSHSISTECSERDPRLNESTLTSESSESRSVNKSALTVKPSETADISSSNNKFSAESIPKLKSNLSHDKMSRATMKSKSKQSNEIVCIDLTDENAPKIVKSKKRTRLSWLQDAKRSLHNKINNMKISTKNLSSSSRRSITPLPVIDNYEQQQQQQQQETATTEAAVVAITKDVVDENDDDDDDKKQLASEKSDASALSNGCSVIRETGRPAAVVTPKTDSEPKVQVEHEDDEAELVAATAVEPTTEPTTNYFDGIDGLTLLASVSAQQMISTKKPELKVKPYTSLQQENESIVDDTMDKVALQVEVCSSETGLLLPKQELVNCSYPLEEQASLEANDNANVILNGETVMLLQKSPNSNLYIINKAAVDSSKLNYNSDEEMMALMNDMPEDIKPALKMEQVIDYPPVYPQHCVHPTYAFCRPYFIPQPSVAATMNMEKAMAMFDDRDSKQLPLKKRLKAQRMMDFAQENHAPPKELGAVVEVATTNNKPPRANGKKDKKINQNVPNCFPRKTSTKKKRMSSAEDEVENNLMSSSAKKARRSSRRGLPAVSYVDEHDAEFNPSGKRKKKRSTR